MAFSMIAHADTLTILHVSDTHSHLAPGGRRSDLLTGSIGGLARAATAIGMVKATEPNVLTLHAGDLFVGDLFFNRYFGVPELRAMKLLGFDAMTLGNHEFDLMPATLIAALDSGFVGGGFPVLSANAVINDPSVTRLRSYVTPYTIKEFDGLKVGIFGLTTPSTNQLSLPLPVMIDNAIVEIAAGMVDTLRDKGCDVIILLSHLGVATDKLVAATVPGINAIIGGHDHFVFPQPIGVRNPSGDTTWVAQAGPYYHNIGKMVLLEENGRVRLLKYELIPLDQAIPEEPMLKEAVAAMIDEIEAMYGPVFSTKIAYCAEDFEEMIGDLTTPGDKDSPVGNLVADAFLAATGADIGIEPGGSTAEPFYRGPVTFDDAFRVVGYGFNTQNGLGFRLATVKLSGTSLIAGIEFGLSEIEIGDDYLLQVAGMSYRYNPEAPIGSRVISAIVDGEPVHPSTVYTIATNEFMLAFLDALQIPYSDPRIIDSTTESQVLATYIAQLDTIHPRKEGRIRAEKPSSVAMGRSPMPYCSLAVVVYPDPCIGQGTIRFTISSMEDVCLTIYNAHGRVVLQRVHQKMPAGTHEVLFDGSNLPAGLYLCRIQSDEATESRLVHVVK
jgi:5'-nucleotidase